MMWIIAAIFSYLFFALASLGDRHLLIGPPSPKIYAFYVGLLGILVVVLIPFVGFSVPLSGQIFISFLTGFIFFLSLLALYASLEKFEASRIIPALGGFMPIFTFILGFFILGQREFLGWDKVVAFFLLVAGSVFISLEKSFKISLKGLFFAGLSAFLLSLYFVFSKMVYLELDFWNGFIWIRIGCFLSVLLLFFSKDIRKEIFKKKKSSFTKKTGVIFLLAQGLGAGGMILQNWSISLVDVAFISFVSALQGVQYIFLFLFIILISLKSKELLKENISSAAIVQKVLAIFLIGAGLAILTV